jgi:RNA ligase (TIGR02306 family)
MEKSTHKVEVVPVILKPHPMADLLSIVDVYGYTVIVRTEEWKDKTIGAYIPPDSVVPDTPQFSYLLSKRIKACKLRGVMSFGLLIPAPEGSKVGDDVAEVLGIIHYDPPEHIAGDEDTTGPSGGYYPKYDVDTLRRYNHLFTNGELVYISEKIHGTNARFVYRNGMMYCGSRTNWKKDRPGSDWWTAFRNHPEIEIFCKANEEVVLYGEVYGRVKHFTYGGKGVRFAAFDILRGTVWDDVDKFRAEVNKYNLPAVPVLAFNHPYSFEDVVQFAEGQSAIPGASNVREGCVVKPMKERTNMEIGRVMLKMVGSGYYKKG